MQNIQLEKPEIKTKEALKIELGINDNEIDIAGDVSEELQSKSDEIVGNLLNIGDKDLTEQTRVSKQLSRLGESVQKDIAKQSQMLKAPMMTLMQDNEEGGAVATDLLSLQEQVSIINPNRVDFTAGTLRRLLAKIPGVGTPLSRWFAKYQQIDSVINDIVKSLQDGRAQLDRDNITLKDDQNRMRQLTFVLEDYIKLAKLIDVKLEKAIGTINDNAAKKAFLQEEILFPVRQRILDLQQQLAVNQQGVLATEVIIRNNRELITGVNRALNVTVTALNTAATLQVALQHQKKVLAGVEAVTNTTNDLIAGTSEQLKTQGAEIQKRAVGAQLDINKLKQSFADIEIALNDISQFRQNALPMMAQSIVEMDEITVGMEKAIDKMEKGSQISSEFILDINN